MSFKICRSSLPQEHKRTLNTHVDITIRYTLSATDGYRIVAFEVEPKSDVLKDELEFTYSVKFIQSEKSIGTRWDHYEFL